VAVANPKLWCREATCDVASDSIDSDVNEENGGQWDVGSGTWVRPSPWVSSTRNRSSSVSDDNRSCCKVILVGLVLVCVLLFVGGAVVDAANTERTSSSASMAGLDPAFGAGE
jgi:hypothetical protein